MPLERRKFVHDLASVYRMVTVMVDQEPHRSVQLIRRIDTRVPVPLVSQHIGSTMGRLVELRSVAGKGVTGSAGAGQGTSGNAGIGAGGTATGRWNVVAKSMGSRSGSTTPARVPSPASMGGTRPGAWVSPSVQALRARERVEGEPYSQALPDAGAGVGDVVQDVPDDWEDGV